MIVVRPATHEDLGFVRDLGEEAFAPYARDSGRSMRAMVGERGTETLVAESSGARAGFVVIQLVRLTHDFGPWQKPVVARINAIAVRPDMRGGGVGRRLVVAAEEAARARSARSMTLMTAERNARARNLFAHAGFVSLTRLERYYAPGQTAILMQKALL